jgi:ABC-type spermidine/putrescine transport system permease subunit I
MINFYESHCLCAPGVLAAFSWFIPTVGEYVTPLLVGGSRGFYTAISSRTFSQRLQTVLGSALSMIMLAATFFCWFFWPRVS